MGERTAPARKVYGKYVKFIKLAYVLIRQILSCLCAMHSVAKYGFATDEIYCTLFNLYKQHNRAHPFANHTNGLLILLPSPLADVVINFLVSLSIA